MLAELPGIFDDEDLEVQDQEVVPDLIIIMDEESYIIRSRKFKDKLRQVEDAIKDFTVDDLVDVDVDLYSAPLADAKDKFSIFRESLRNFYEEFDRDAHVDWEEEWEGKLEALHKKQKQNEREVRAKVVTLKNEKRGNENVAVQAAGNRNQEEKEERVTKAKAEIDRQYILSKLIELQGKLKQVGHVVDLKDHEVIQFLKESNSWSSTLSDLEKKDTELKKLVVLYPFESGPKDEWYDLFACVKNDVYEVVSKLKAADAERKLYTLARSQSKDAVPYPVFKSKETEDVHKFIKEFKEAFVRNQVAQKDQCKIFRTNLKGFALDIVSKDIEDVDKAYKLLIKQFGNTDQIWSARYKVFLAECQKKWPSLEENPKERYQKLSKLMEQLEELQILVDEKNIDKGELYNATNVTKLFSLIPTDLRLKTRKKLTAESSSEDKVEGLKKTMKEFKELAQLEMMDKLDIEEVRKKQSGTHYEEKKDYREKRNYEQKRDSGDKFMCFICEKEWNEKSHIKDWGIFGCNELLKVDTEARIKELIKRKLCFNCGYKFCPKGRDCGFLNTKGLKEVRCIANFDKKGRCYRNGLTCNHKEVDPLVKEKVKKQLKIELKGFNFVHVDPKVLNIEIQATSNEQHPQQQVFGNLQGRIEDLQSGEVSKQMEDKELHEFFRERERNAGGDVEKILAVPEGEALFIFCVIKGKTRPLRAFMDNGCSSWLVKNGVPENELRSAKLRSGPIPMWVAGGHTVYATAEWASLLPLNNGCHQIVKGLSVDTVTGPFGDIDMAPVMNEIKKVAKNNKEVNRLRAPQNVSGDTDMLIGIGLNCVFPEPVFTTPEGLTLFKSKFLPGCEGEIACVGGPSKTFSAS